MSEGGEITSEELDKFFELNEKIKARAQEVAQFCTSIKPYENVEAILNHGDEDVGILVWSNELGYDGYAFSKRYLFMSGSEIKADLKKMQEEVKRQVEMEKNVRLEIIEQVKRDNKK